MEIWLTWVFSFGAVILATVQLYINERTKAKIKSEFDTKLEKIRDNFSKERLLLNASINSQNNSSAIAQQERLDAIKEVWKNYLEIIKEVEGIRLLDQVRSIKSINDTNTENPKGIIEQVSLSITRSFSRSNTKKMLEKIEPIRPFLNTDIWYLFYTFSNICGQILYSYNYSINKKQKFIHWTNDTASIGMVASLLNDENKLKLIKDSDYGSFDIFINFIEIKLIEELTKIINGSNEAQRTFDEGIRFANLQSKFGKIKEKNNMLNSDS